MTNWLREPLAHFLLLGAALFALFYLVGGREAGSAGDIVVTQGKIEQLALGFARVWQRSPAPSELQALIEAHIREEVLYREALAMGLDRDDTVVRRRLAQKLEFLTEDAAAMSAPTPEELQAYLQAHPDAFRAEPQIAFRQVALDPERRGSRVADDVRKLLATLSETGAAADIAALGDSRMLPQELPLTARADIVAQFGEKFTQDLERVHPGRWAGPIESGYGVHLVYVGERTAGRLRELSEVRDAVQVELLNERRKQLGEATYRALRERYAVRIEPAASAGLIPPAQAAQ